MSHLPERALAAWIAVCGSASLISLVAVYAGLSFDALRALLPLALPLAGLALALPESGPVRRDLPGAVPWSRVELLGLGSLALAGLVAATALNKPDGDDAYYLNAAFAHLEHPGLPLLSFDGMHGDPAAPINQVVHRPQSYELWVAWWAWLTGLSPRSVYWVVLPAVWGALVPVANAVLARALVPRAALAQAAVAMGVLLLWGDGHRAFGNWSFVRVFQGKGVLVSIAVLAITWCAIRWARAPSARSGALLLLAQLAAIGFSSSALVVAPIAAGLALLAGARDRVSLGRAALGLLTTLPGLVALGLVRWELGGNALAEDGDPHAWSALLGDGGRFAPVALAFVAGPVLAWAAGAGAAGWWTRYAGWSVALVVNPWTGTLLAERVASLFNWRLLWAVPVPALVALSASLLLVAPGRLRLAGGFAATIWLVGFGLGGPTTWDRGSVRVTWAAPRVGPTEAVALDVLRRVGPDATVLAPFRVAGRLTNHPDRPRLVAVRDLYVSNLTRHWGREEGAERMALLRLVEGRSDAVEREVALALLPRWCPEIVVSLDQPGLVRPIERRGYAVERRLRGYAVLARAPGGCRGGPGPD